MHTRLDSFQMRLGQYVDDLQRRGRLWFTKEEALAAIGCSANALKQSLVKLRAKKRIAIIKTKFILIIPLEYQRLGIVPGNWFIDPLMKLLDIPYYIGVLSAAQLQGAAHQKPMQFQVVVGQSLRDIKIEQLHIRFIYSDKISRTPTNKIQVHTGYALTSTPEATAFDVCKYYKAAGYWNNVATVLSELREEVDPKKLAELANSELYDLPVIQRLGYLLSLPEVEGAYLTEELAKIVHRKKARWERLYPGAGTNGAAKDPIWRIYINTEVDIDI